LFRFMSDGDGNAAGRLRIHGCQVIRIVGMECHGADQWGRTLFDASCFAVFSKLVPDKRGLLPERESKC